MPDPDPGQSRPLPANDCDWQSGHLAALYQCDRRGRITTRRTRDRSPAPRFHLGRTRHGNVWRVRADLPRDLARRLSRLASREPPLPSRIADWSPPERLAAIHAALDVPSPVRAVWAGPLYRSPSDADLLRSIDERAAGSRVVAGHDPSSMREIAAAFPFLGLSSDDHAPIAVSLDRGRIAAVCHRATGPVDGFAEPGVFTLPEFRRRGHAIRAVAGWWSAVRAAEGTPIYATTWDNTGSLGVARALGLVAFGDACHWT